MEFFSFYFLLGIVTGMIRGFRLCGFWELGTPPKIVNLSFPVPFGYAMFWDRARRRVGVRNDGMWTMGKRWLPHLRVLYHLPELAAWFMNGIDDRPLREFGPWRFTNGWQIIEEAVHIDCLLNKGKHLSKVRDIKARIAKRPIPSHLAFSPALFNWYLTGVESMAIDMNVDHKAFEKELLLRAMSWQDKEIVRLLVAEALTMAARGQIPSAHRPEDDEPAIPDLPRDLKKHNKRIEVRGWRLLTTYGEYADRSEWGGLCLAKIYWPLEDEFIFTKGELTLRISDGNLQEVRGRFNRDLEDQEIGEVYQDLSEIVAAIGKVSEPPSRNATDMWDRFPHGRSDALSLEGEVQPGEEAWYDFE